MTYYAWSAVLLGLLVAAICIVRVVDLFAAGQGDLTTPYLVAAPVLIGLCVCAAVGLVRRRR